MDKLNEDLNQGQSTLDNQIDASRVNDVKLKQRLSEIRSEKQSLHALTESILRRFILLDMNASQEIQSLLKCFNLERGCPEKPMPNVESGGKNK